MNTTVNPFSITFGVAPDQMIKRFSPTEKIIDTFTSEKPSSHLFMISGVRGSGKTVLLTGISEQLSKMRDWIVINVTPDVDILVAIISRLYQQKELKKLFVKAGINLSFLGLSVKIDKEQPQMDSGALLESMIKILSENGKRILISIDEIINNSYVKVFSSTFQLLLRQKLPVFLIMTGLYENIRRLKNEKTLTFLYRAPMEILEPLNLNSIARSYAATFQLEPDKAREMAELTKGYAFAYQVMGYLYFEQSAAQKKEVSIDELLPEYDDYLDTYSYEKIWSELPLSEKNIISLLSENEARKVSDIRNELNISSNDMASYRDRLKRKGLILTEQFGYMTLTLPRFSEIIRTNI
ncbi:MAG: ATP-binding protein [Eubacterium sp.]|nr:ATP-binding protein [Eubacterium sp.]